MLSSFSLRVRHTRPFFHNVKPEAWCHRATADQVILRFGRYPPRNLILFRDSADYGVFADRSRR
ncbi:hypothetical protein Z950_534 [Sulfitobacter mediterraneus KCTC 32188]|nr:hypothetical protein Z950_534 [Sulfitobacter mediterraneus KCTC 32188]